MPTYHYQCPKCEKIKEVFHWMSEKPEIKCPDCEEVMVKAITGCNIIIKPEINIDKCINDGW